MGVDLLIYVNKKDVRKLLDLDSELMDWNDFYFLLSQLSRWYVFQNRFGLDSSEPITANDLLKHIAKVNMKIKDRERLVDILSKYDLIFAPDTARIKDENYIETEPERSLGIKAARV